MFCHEVPLNHRTRPTPLCEGHSPTGEPGGNRLASADGSHMDGRKTRETTEWSLCVDVAHGQDRVVNSRSAVSAARGVTTPPPVQHIARKEIL